MRKEMEEKIFQSTEVDAILLTSPANMRFVAGFTGEGYVYFSRRQKVVVTVPDMMSQQKRSVRVMKLRHGQAMVFFKSLGSFKGRRECAKAWHRR